MNESINYRDSLSYNFPKTQTVYILVQIARVIHNVIINVVCKNEWLNILEYSHCAFFHELFTLMFVMLLNPSVNHKCQQDWTFRQIIHGRLYVIKCCIITLSASQQINIYSLIIFKSKSTELKLFKKIDFSF